MAILPTIGGKDVLHPNEALEAAQRIGTPFDFWQRANSYTCPVGPEPGVAWLLLKRKDLDKLDPEAFHDLEWRDGSRKITIRSLIIVRHYSINRARPGDKDAARLVEFRDRRHLFRMSSVNKQYNVRRPAPNVTSGTRLYYEESLAGETIDGGTIWTWQEIVDDLWQKLPDTGTNQAEFLAGDPGPALRYDPDEDPEGFRFIGENAWDALHAVLDKLHMTTNFNPVLDLVGPYVDKSATQSGLSDALDKLTSRLIYDYDPDNLVNLAKYPEVIRVFFPRREQYHGIELDTTDTDNWEMNPVVSKDFLTGFDGAHRGTVIRVWDDLAALFNAAGVNTNPGGLQTRADEVAGNIKNTLAFDRMRRTYSGLLTESAVLPGSEVSELRWRDYGDADGLVTELLHRSEHDEFVSRPSDRAVNEHLKPPDLSRHTHPLWPRLGQPVQVDDGSSAIGADLTANASGLFPGVVRRWAAGAWTTLDTCWIRPTDLEAGETPSESNVVMLRQKDTLVGRLSGSETVSGDTRPIYLVRLGAVSTGGGEHKLARNDGSIIAAKSGTTPGTSSTVVVWEFANGTIAATVNTITVYNTTDYPVPANEFITLHKEMATGRWLVDMDGQHTIEGFSAGADGSETLFPYEILKFIGDRDESAVVGNIIDVSISKAAGVVDVDIVATGGLFTITDAQSPTPGTATIDLADDVDLSSSIDETEDVQWAQFKVTDVASDPAVDLVFGRMLTVTDDQSSPNTESFYPREELKFKTVPSGGATVTKVASTVTVTLDIDGMDIGDIVYNFKAPILDTGKWYKDDGTGSANLNWALMDGTSNATPGSGIQLATESGTEAEFFIRALSGTAAATNTRFGRDSVALTADPDDDEVQIEVAVANHVDHVHDVTPNVCHVDPGAGSDNFDFLAATGNFTSIQKKATSTIGDALTLTHIVTVTLTNDQAGSGTDKIEMTPDHKKLHVFEKVA